MINFKGGEKLQQFLTLVKKQKAKIEIGFFEDSKYIDGTQIAEIAIYNEFGVPENNLPPRPFLHPTYDNQKNKWIKILANTIDIQKDNIDVKKALSKVGLIAQNDVRNSIDEWAKSGEPRNAPRTIKAKGFDSPLIHTGQMRDAVNYKVTS